MLAVAVTAPYRGGQRWLWNTEKESQSRFKGLIYKK